MRECARFWFSVVSSLSLIFPFTNPFYLTGNHLSALQHHPFPILPYFDEESGVFLHLPEAQLPQHIVHGLVSATLALFRFNRSLFESRNTIPNVSLGIVEVHKKLRRRVACGMVLGVWSIHRGMD